MSAPSSPAVGLDQALGHWLDADLIAWPAGLLGGFAPDALDWRLHWSQDGHLDPAAAEPVPWGTCGLGFDPRGVPDAERARFPHLSQHLALRLPPTQLEHVPEMLRARLAVSVHHPSGRLLRASGLQLPGVLDRIYPAAVEAELGPVWTDGIPTLRLWAPTARGVWLLLWADDVHVPAQRVAMQRAGDGTWAVTGAPDWVGARYKFEVTVYVPYYERVLANQVTDPYSQALTVNSTYSVLVDLSDPALAPQQWLTAAPPALENPVDQVIYELHLRDFSVHDSTVPVELRGSFLAATADSDGMAHLRRLVAAGLNTVGLLPMFDNATVEEHPARRQRPPKDLLKQLPPDSPEQQRLLSAPKGRDGFNWGYDPWHYFAPEGSFASTLAAADGAGRVTECRTMIGAFHASGLRVVLDQVFNHTAHSGQDAKSVLDRIVPGYYYRLNAIGEIEDSTCCANVATEHAMAGKLMVDACRLWVKHYKVDGFRFDLMGHHSRANLEAVRAGLDALTLEADGVDGRTITMYGEGWNFGEVADNARFYQASQGQLGGTGIATFNDRLRDAVRGGSVWDADPRGQGFGSGLSGSDNGTGASGDRVTQEQRLAWYTDLVSLGLAGNLRDFRFHSLSRNGELRGAELDFGGRPAGYATEPFEIVNYVDAHDNETLFDALTLKLHPATSMADRVRQNTVCLALATLSQAPVLWHAGTDMLRSKSLDANSYNSGDWFNFLDFSMRDNGFGAGLPPEAENAERWRLYAPLLADARLKPKPEHLRAAHEAALELLRVRSSSRLFRLGSAAAIKAAVTFPVAGTWQHTPGTIVMAIEPPTQFPEDPTQFPEDPTQFPEDPTQFPEDPTQFPEDPTQFPELVEGASTGSANLGGASTGSANYVDPFAAALIVFNPTAWLVRQSLPLDFAGYRLHPAQAGGSDPVVKTCGQGADWVSVPGRTVAVFVRPTVG
ncbi:MAG: pullulanase-type alpha-1,6-glucosidase [Propionicimonas sp.]|uniref:pullulanase-type alpha-1,6-glucosidase n=1 Tax=Propionicimonas sp. TaxID=1955623 RepID=UPI001D2CC1D2|nr:pullulanase-type alpha-1,6-glucosidase [Propionicimonas sp.]MBU4189318.1 pullulanase-type alpha-1,6-glucosidase [Actinomycetota bacterium]MBU4251170.1 pullulanase-type alpha-1,6-glucosidase [Actinomycetota bacterium]MBU4363144.1 pullulanase-type alpha-1,6-glucosidase [Actinomycetota bacterium]MBU4410951.1 pullulanase-type alpha-1,6-glucosidase [Actinomycetota bacterium]MBU4416297.1 pullulanase-type alpha-1,6-glucosidase [Actinomycetota bacterium]